MTTYTSPNVKTACLCADTCFGKSPGTAGALCSEFRLIAPLIPHKFLFWGNEGSEGYSMFSFVCNIRVAAITTAPTNAWGWCHQSTNNLLHTDGCTGLLLPNVALQVTMFLLYSCPYPLKGWIPRMDIPTICWKLRSVVVLRVAGSILVLPGT